jgi:hypothetical protein
VATIPQSGSQMRQKVTFSSTDIAAEFTAKGVVDRAFAHAPRISGRQGL